ncbi:MAG: hypothetical protein D6757_08015 [Alphaproteobacteria bacterium]|nr:MAG: hypothetical protein D6757_08015 [Alphaproteobacteria bacterium]
MRSCRSPGSAPRPAPSAGARRMRNSRISATGWSASRRCPPSPTACCGSWEAPHARADRTPFPEASTMRGGRSREVQPRLQARRHRSTSRCSFGIESRFFCGSVERGKSDRGIAPDGGCPMLRNLRNIATHCCAGNSGLPAFAFALMAAVSLAPGSARAATGDCPTAHPASAKTVAARVICLVDHDHLLDAIVQGEKALGEWPEDAHLISALARAYEESGNRKKALAYHEKAYHLAPDDPLIAYRLASMLADEVDRLAPIAQGARPPKRLAHCFADIHDRRAAKRRMAALAKRADRLFAQAVEGFSRQRGEDDMLTLNARMERALLHVTTKGHEGIPELEAVAAAFRRVADRNGDPAMADMASGVYLNLAQAHAMEGDAETARRIADEAMALARSNDQKRLVEASMDAIVNGDSGAMLIEAMAGAPDCTLTTDRPMPADGLENEQ